MSVYDRRAWDDVVRRRETTLSRRTRQVVPERARDWASERVGTVARRAKDLPAAEEVTAAVNMVVEGATDILAQVALTSVNTRRVVARFDASDSPPVRIADLRSLDLQVLDDIRPRGTLGHMAVAGASGVAAGVAITGGEALAVFGGAAGGTAGAAAGGVGAAPGAGVGAAPGAGTVLGALAADAAMSTLVAMRVVFRTSAYYGYDAREPEERLRALAVMIAATAPTQTAKNRAFREFDELVQLLARRATWKRLSENQVTKIVQRVFRKRVENLTKAGLARLVPVLTMFTGGALNARAVQKTADAADLLYRQRLLSEKYGIESDVSISRRGQLPAADSQDVDIIEIIDSEVAESQPDRPGMTEIFSLRFPPNEIAALADRYSYADDSEASRAGAAAAARGSYSVEELRIVCGWKTPRSKKLVARNDPEEIGAATRVALTEETSERERMESVLTLHGVAVPTASALLHFTRPEVYPILDIRALEALGVEGRSSYSVSFWLRYLEACRSLAANHGVTIRQLDKALWQYSKER